MTYLIRSDDIYAFPINVARILLQQQDVSKVMFG